MNTEEAVLGLLVILSCVLIFAGVTMLWGLGAGLLAFGLVIILWEWRVR